MFKLITGNVLCIHTFFMKIFYEKLLISSIFMRQELPYEWGGCLFEHGHLFESIRDTKNI